MPCYYLPKRYIANVWFAAIVLADINVLLQVAREDRNAGESCVPSRLASASAQGDRRIARRFAECKHNTRTHCGNTTREKVHQPPSKLFCVRIRLRSRTALQTWTIP